MKMFELSKFIISGYTILSGVKYGDVCHVTTSTNYITAFVHTLVIIAQFCIAQNENAIAMLRLHDSIIGIMMWLHY